MKAIVLLTIFLIISLAVNVFLYFATAVQSDSLALIPTLETELKIFSVLLPKNLTKNQIQKKLSENGYDIKASGEYYYAPKPNSTLAINNTFFIFNSSDELIQINSSSNSLTPVYEKP
ncbi:MAG: hypothetical protein QNK27_10405 [Desulfuromusa sp.]|nr:hypothetical protein [Desulfuromusa sp.]